MATVYVARMSGAAGFSRTVAVKRLHPHLAADPTFAAMFVDEARLAARIRHPNVIDTLDVVADSGELFLVMAFVLGETLSKLVRATTSQGIRLPVPVVSNIIFGALEGLHAAHEATDEQGEPLGIVHRDVSPQNILVGADGIARVIDFGVAKAAGRMQETEGGELKGKLAYMAPEQLTRCPVDRRCDVFAMGVVLWETLTSRRLFAGDDAASTLYSVLNDPVLPPSSVCPDLPPALDAVVLRALERDPAMRFATAREMSLALEAACPPGSSRHTAEWVQTLGAESLRIRAEVVRSVEQQANQPPSTIPPSGDDLASMGGGADSPRVTGSSRLATLTQTSTSGISNISGVSGMTGTTGTSGVTSSGYSDPSRATRIHPVEVERRLPVSAVVGICAVLTLMLAVGLVTGIKAITYRASRAADDPTLATTPGSVTLPAMTTAMQSTSLPPAEPPPPAMEPAPIAPPVASASAVTTSEPVATSPTGTTVRAARPATAPPRPSTKPPTRPAPDCENPFTVDANGVKRPKPQCFDR